MTDSVGCLFKYKGEVDEWLIDLKSSLAGLGLVILLLGLIIVTILLIAVIKFKSLQRHN